MQCRLGYVRQLVSFNWLKSGKLSSGTSHDKVVSHEGGEGPRESEDLEATETERIGMDQREENERESGKVVPEETEEEGRRWQKRGDEGEHQTRKKERKYDQLSGSGLHLGGRYRLPKASVRRVQCGSSKQMSEALSQSSPAHKTCQYKSKAPYKSPLQPQQSCRSCRKAKNKCSFIHALGLRKTHYGLHICSVTE